MAKPAEAAAPRPRARELGLAIGVLPPGPLNALTDVGGVRVGQATVSWGDGPLQPGHGPARTGVTVILPHAGNLFREKVPAAIHVINGFGKCMGIEQVEELGTIESPIALTSTLCVGRVADALVGHGIRENPEIGITTSTINPIVGECSDAVLNDIQGRHVTEDHVLAAIDGARDGPVEEGAVGAGTGMIAFGYKGGIGTASRVTAALLGGWTVGVLVLANFGRRPDLVIDGVPVGRALAQQEVQAPERGSIMIVVATDAPLLDRGLRRIARRAGIGLARTGSMGGHGSGDVVIAFSAAPSVRIPHAPGGVTVPVEIVAEDGPAINALFAATVEATEEAIVNALFRATTVVGRDGNIAYALPLEPVRQLLVAADRIDG
ncbi:MAG TPA: P1 family peptidase [Thermomicrobiales bacterium]|jgi:D-aminopeptidase